MTQPKEAIVTLLDPKTGKRSPCLISKVGWAMATYGYTVADPEEYARVMKDGGTQPASPEDPAIRPEPVSLPETSQGEIVKPVAARKQPRPAMSARMIPEPH